MWKDADLKESHVCCEAFEYVVIGGCYGRCAVKDDGVHDRVCF
jgi:hypothetical protein